MNRVLPVVASLASLAAALPALAHDAPVHVHHAGGAIVHSAPAMAIVLAVALAAAAFARGIRGRWRMPAGEPRRLARKPSGAERDHSR